jgi:hypothetical protein
MNLHNGGRRAGTTQRGEEPLDIPRRQPIELDAAAARQEMGVDDFAIPTQSRRPCASWAFRSDSHSASQAPADSASDVIAAHMADVACIGFAVSDAKAGELSASGADTISSDLSRIATALLATT